jgi:hypothetical protein
MQLCVAIINEYIELVFKKKKKKKQSVASLGFVPKWQLLENTHLPNRGSFDLPAQAFVLQKTGQDDFFSKNFYLNASMTMCMKMEQLYHIISTIAKIHVTFRDTQPGAPLGKGNEDYRHPKLGGNHISDEQSL